MAAETTPEGEEAPASFCVPVADRDTYNALVRVDNAIRDACLYGVLNDEDGMVLDRARRAVSLQRMTRGEAPLSGPDLYEWAKERATLIRPDRSRLVDGATFVLRGVEPLPALWGEGDELLWSPGQSTWVCGDTGTGKTTLILQLVLRRIGVLTGPLLGYPVAVDSRPVLYLALDRPIQVALNMARMVNLEDPAVLAVLRERLMVLDKPLGFDIAQEPDRLAEWCQGLGVGCVVMDSLKDMAMDLTKPDIGQRVNLAMQTVMAAAVDLLVAQHTAKPPRENRNARRVLADILGPAYLQAGVGSVLLLDGQPGDPMPKLRHLKPLVAPVGPIGVELTRDGRVVVRGEGDLLGLLRSSPNGLTARRAAEILEVTADPAAGQMRTHERALDRLADRNLAHKVMGKRGGAGGSAPAMWYPITNLLPPDGE